MRLTPNLGALLVAAACCCLPGDAPAKRYRATKDDFEAVQDGIAAAQTIAPAIFPKGIGDIDAILYDSDDLYIWTRTPPLLPLKRIGAWREYSIYMMPHRGLPTDEEMGFCGGNPEFVRRALGRETARFSFSCSPMGAQIAIQKKRRSVYDTRDGYLATIVHEFGHQYMSRELGQIDTVRRLAPLVRKEVSGTSSGEALEEAYGIWCELTASKRLFPDHYRRLRAEFDIPWSKRPHYVGFRAAAKLIDGDAAAVPL